MGGSALLFENCAILECKAVIPLAFGGGPRLPLPGPPLHGPPLPPGSTPLSAGTPRPLLFGPRWSWFCPRSCLPNVISPGSSYSYLAAAFLRASVTRVQTDRLPGAFGANSVWILREALRFELLDKVLLFLRGDIVTSDFCFS
jgi:hypothetical protein